MPIAPTPVPELTDGVVTLRAHCPADVDGLVAMANDPATARWTSVPVPYERRHGERWVHEVAPGGWRDGSDFRWAVEAADGGVPRFAGNVDLHTGVPPFVSFAAAPWARGRGLVARAVRLVTRWGFAEAGLPVVHWWAHAGNLASWRVAHACGFAFDGARPLSLPHRGSLRDGWFASLRPDHPEGPRTTWWPVRELVGERVRLRAHEEADLERIAQACSDAQSRRWLAGLPHPFTADDARRSVLGYRLAESLGQRVTWAVADRADGLLLANVTLFGLDDAYSPTGAEIGYWAHPDARGRGAVAEAVQLVLDHAFAPREAGGLGRTRVQLGAAASNAASRRVAERAGFTLVATTRRDCVVGVGTEQVVDDGVLYDLLAEERS